MPLHKHFATNSRSETREAILAWRAEAAAAGGNRPPFRRWVTNLDGRECRLCHALNFTIWPADFGPRAPLHVHCRCRTEPAALHQLVRRAEDATRRDFPAEPRPRSVIRTDRKRRIFVVHRERP